MAASTTNEVVLLQEKQNLLEVAKELVDKLEGPEVGIWKILFGVSNAFNPLIWSLFGAKLELTSKP